MVNETTKPVAACSAACGKKKKKMHRETVFTCRSFGIFKLLLVDFISFMCLSTVNRGNESSQEGKQEPRRESCRCRTR